MPNSRVLTPARSDQADEHAQRRRLARAVGPSSPHTWPRSTVNAEVVDREQTGAELLRQSCDLDHRHDIHLGWLGHSRRTGCEPPTTHAPTQCTTLCRTFARRVAPARRDRPEQSVSRPVLRRSLLVSFWLLDAWRLARRDGGPQARTTASLRTMLVERSLNSASELAGATECAPERASRVTARAPFSCRRRSNAGWCRAVRARR